MKKFRFRLEKVLQYREIIKGEKKRELSLCLAALREEEEKLEKLYKAQAENNMPEGVQKAGIFFLKGQYSERLKKEIIQKKLDILEAENKVEIARHAYIEAAKDAKTLEMLKSKKQDQYNEVVRLEEAKILDEVVVQRSSRQKVL